MSHLKKAGFISATIFLMFFVACGGGSSNNNSNNNNNNNNTPVVNISITQTLTVLVGNTGTLIVTRTNTDDFTLSVSPASGAFCVKATSAVTCTPTTAGTYTVTVTATADATKSSSATLTVTQGSQGGNDIDLAAIEKASVKYKYNVSLVGNVVQELEYTIVATFDNYGMRFRLDTIDQIVDGQRLSIDSTIIIDHSAKTFLNGYLYDSEENWVSMPYDDFVGNTEITGNRITGGYYITDLESLAAEFNLSRLPDRTILGRVCQVYTGFDPEDGTKSTVAYWNGLLMFNEFEVEGGSVSLEAQAVTFDVPASAFTQTLNITWIQ